MGKLSFTFGLLLFLSLLMSPHSFSETKPVRLISSTPSEFSEENLIIVINKSGISHKDVFLAQVMKESANYTSDVFKNANNLCGMKVPGTRETVAIGTYKGYAVYKSWEHSVEDYFLWQQRAALKYKTREAFLSYVGRTYAQDSTYLYSLRNILHKNRKFFNKVLE